MAPRLRSGWRLAIVMGALTIFVVEEACTKDSGNAGSTGEGPAPTAAKPAPAPEAVTPPTPIASGFGVPISPNKCPSAVRGATTTVKELPDGVEVTVIAPGGPPINDIRQRGVQIVAASKDPAAGGSAAADGLDTCPVVAKDTTIVETDVPGGAAFSVKPLKAARLADLKSETKSRASSYVGEH